MLYSNHVTDLIKIVMLSSYPITSLMEIVMLSSNPIADLIEILYRFLFLPSSFNLQTWLRKQLEKGINDEIYCCVMSLLQLC